MWGTTCDRCPRVAQRCHTRCRTPATQERLRRELDRLRNETRELGAARQLLLNKGRLTSMDKRRLDHHQEKIKRNEAEIKQNEVEIGKTEREIQDMKQEV